MESKIKLFYENVHLPLSFASLLHSPSLTFPYPRPLHQIAPILTVSNFSFMKYTQRYLKKSSMRVIMHLLPFIDEFFTLPNTSKCTNSKGALDSNFEYWKGSLCALPNWHPPHIIFEIKSSFRSPFTMPRLDISYNFVYLEYPSRACPDARVSSCVYSQDQTCSNTTC